MRLLVVEDDPSIAEPLSAGLRREGFEIELAGTGAMALEADECDLVLLDLGLPDMDGRDVCRLLRQRSRVPIIVVTARGDEIDRVILLELGRRRLRGQAVRVPRARGAHPRRLAADRRAGEPAAPDPCIVVGQLAIDTRTRSVTLEGKPVSLTPKEHDLLVYLARDPGAVLTRKQLIEDVWDQNWWGSTKTLDVHIASLRKKLSPELIETVRGVGFRLAEATGAP